MYTKAKKTKRYIIEKTADIFNKQGYAGTSLADLTRATGLTKGSIYGNFTGKHEVAVAAFNYNYQNLIKKFGSILHETEGRSAKMHRFLSIYEDAYEEIMQWGGCPILNNAVDADDTDEELAHLSVKAFNYWEDTLSAMMDEGFSDADGADRIDVKYYASLFIATIEGSLMLSKVTGERHHFSFAIAHLRSIVDGIFK
jgi:TetR/AcrR family transcriptional repressor of nem operon